jgi:hypothetical protein
MGQQSDVQGYAFITGLERAIVSLADSGSGPIYFGIPIVSADFNDEGSRANSKADAFRL